jgi:hypothetical protein
VKEDKWDAKCAFINFLIGLSSTVSDMVQRKGSDRPRAGERYSILSGPEEQRLGRKWRCETSSGKGKSDITRG